MKRLVDFERFCLIGHIATMVFGLAGLLVVLPHPELIAGLSTLGQTLFRWSMAGGGVVYIILGAVAAAIYAYRTLGLRQCLTFAIPAAVLSLSSELLGTSTGFPFGEYGYLNGLGYKIAGLVPFTIPLSWFYMGFACYLIARTALEGTVKVGQPLGWWRQIGAVAIGATLLTAWDFVLDPAMSRTLYPFWYYGEDGIFFGTPLQNFAGWLATGTLFMSVAALLWPKTPLVRSRQQLKLPLALYLSNVIFSALMSVAGAGLWLPVSLTVVLGVVPILILWRVAPAQPTPPFDFQQNPQVSEEPTAEVSMASIGVMPK